MRFAYCALHAVAIPPAVIAGLVPATPIMRHGCAQMIGVAGTSPAMTFRENELYR
jgi:hypothetical protein